MQICLLVVVFFLGGCVRFECFFHAIVKRHISHCLPPSDALMVTTLRLDRIVSFASKNMFHGDNWRPEVYMEALQSCGFADVRMENRTDKLISFQAIYATVAK